MPVDVVLEAANNFQSAIGKTVRSADVQKVWDCVGQWIEQCLVNRKGALVPGLGTFALCERRLDAGLGRPPTSSRPAFLVAERLAAAFAVRQRRCHISGEVACHMIHYGAVAALADLDRGTVKTCIREVTQALARLLWRGADAALSLGPVGRLAVVGGEATLEFADPLTARLRDLAEERRTTVRPVHPWSPCKILP